MENIAINIKTLPEEFKSIFSGETVDALVISNFVENMMPEFQVQTEGTVGPDSRPDKFEITGVSENETYHNSFKLVRITTDKLEKYGYKKDNYLPYNDAAIFGEMPVFSADAPIEFGTAGVIEAVAEAFPQLSNVISISKGSK